MFDNWIILTLISAFLFSVKDILSKKLFSKNVNTKQIIFEEYFLMLIVVIFFFNSKINLNIFFDNWSLFLFKAISLISFSIIYLNLLEKYEISKVSPLLNLSPVFLIFFSSIFLGERLSGIQFIGIFIIVISIFILEIHVTHHNQKLPHLHIIKFLKKMDKSFFISSFLMLIIISLTAVSDKLIFRNDIGVYTNIFFTSSIIFIILVLYYIKKNYLKTALKNIFLNPEILLVSVFSISSTFFILFAISLPTALLSLVVPLKRTSTLFSSIFGGMLFHESHLFKKIISIFLMLLGLILIVI